jgi:hypothetical protein
MAIDWVRQAFDVDAELTTDGLSATVKFLVKTTAATDGWLAVMAAAGIPQQGDSYNLQGETSDNLIVKRVKPRRPKPQEQPLLWEVEVVYEVRDPTEGPDWEAGYPPSKPVKYSRRTGYEQAEMVVDAAGTKVQNAAGDPFLDAIPDEKPYTILTLEKNVEYAFDFDSIESLRNTTNSSPFTSPLGNWDADEGRIVNVDADGEYDATYGAYATLRIEIHFRKSAIWVPSITAAQILPASRTLKPWDVTRRNIGTRYKTGGVLYVAKDSEGFVVTEGLDLTSAGDKAAVAADPYYYVFKRCASASWAPLASILSPSV